MVCNRRVAGACISESTCACNSGRLGKRAKPLTWTGSSNAPSRTAPLMVSAALPSANLTRGLRKTHRVVVREHPAVGPGHEVFERLIRRVPNCQPDQVILGDLVLSGRLANVATKLCHLADGQASIVGHHRHGGGPELVLELTDDCRFLLTIHAALQSTPRTAQTAITRTSAGSILIPGPMVAATATLLM